MLGARCCPWQAGEIHASLFIGVTCVKTVVGSWGSGPGVGHQEGAVFGERRAFQWQKGSCRPVAVAT